MRDFDPRILRVGVEIGGETVIFDQLQLSCSISKVATPTDNDCTIKITNATKAHRDTLLIETARYGANRARKGVWIEAGRESTGTARIFTGDITAVNITQPPDITVEIKSRTGAWERGNIITVDSKPRAQLSELATAAAESMDLELVFEAEDKALSNWAYTGSAQGQVQALSAAGRVNSFIDDGKLVIKDAAKALASRDFALSMDSGMVGIPEITEQGIKVKYLFEPTTALGGSLTVESKLNPGANGTYTIFKLSYELANRDDPWYCIVEGKRNGR